MKAHELLAITQEAVTKRNNERPTKLFDELIGKMKSEAKSGYDHIDFVFSDPMEVVNVVLDRLQEHGYAVSKREKGVHRISWGHAVDERCQFDIAWVGRCKQVADKTGFCEEHKKEKCRCGKQAVRSCDATIGAFVCGATTCGRCSHHH